MIPVRPVLSLYRAFVAMCMWNWFATKAFHAPRVTYLEMLGVVWLVGLLINKPGSWETLRWKRLYGAFDPLVPEDRKDVSSTTINERKEGMWFELANATFDELVSNTITLVLGFMASRFV